MRPESGNIAADHARRLRWTPELRAAVGLVACTALLAAFQGGALLLRAVAATACCLALLRATRERLTISAVLAGMAAVVLVTPWAGSSAALAGRMVGNAAVFWALVAVFRLAAAGPGLGSWQAAAAGGLWLLLGGVSHGLLGVAVLAAALLRRQQPGALERDERAFNTFLGGALAVLAIAGSGIMRGSLVYWLLPLLPLALDAAASRLRAWTGAPVPPMMVCHQLAEAGGGWHIPRRVVATLGLGWCGMAGWWGQATVQSPLYVLPMAIAPLLFAFVVLALAKRTSARPSRPVAADAALHARIRGLDGLRAFAVALVVLSHAGLMESDFWQRSGTVKLLNAQVGVQIFFVLSGLLITRLLLAEHARMGRIDQPRFYVRRLLRIFPVYYAAIAVSFALAASAVYPIKHTSFAAAIAYVMNFASWDAMEATFSHFWSLAVEEHFYFLWPLALVLARGRIGLAGVLAGLAIALMVGWQSYPPAFVPALADRFAIGRWTVPAALPILVGCLATILLWRRAVSRPVSAAVGTAGLAAFLLPVAPAVHALVPAGLQDLVSSAAIAAMMGFVVCRQNSIVVRLLETRVLVYLGTISYGIYVWQGILTGNGSYRQVPGWPPEPVLGAVAACVVAMASYHFFEKPVLAYKDRLTGTHGRP